MLKLVGEYLKRPSFWAVAFFIVLVVGTALHLSTLTFSPVAWLDEVQIIEIAQGGVGEKTSGWSMCFPARPEYQGRAWAVYYLGGALNELAYQSFGVWGPRSASLLGLVLSAILLFWYVHRRSRDGMFAFAISNCFFSLPCVTQSVRGARVDIWPVFCLFLGLHILLGAKSRRKCGWAVSYFCAGFLSVTGCFFWAVGAFLLPIYVWGFFCEFPKPFRQIREWLTPAALAIMGALIGVVIWLIPFYGDLGLTFEMAQWISSFNSNSPTCHNICSAWRGFVGFSTSFPFLCLIGFIVILFVRGQWWLKIGLIVMTVVCVVVAARIYVFRFVYFSTFAVLGALMVSVWKNERRMLYRTIRLALVILSLAACCISVVLRNGVEFLARKGRSYSILRETLLETVGRNVNVYTTSYEVYYAGRELGWKMFTSPIGGGADPLLIGWEKIDCVLCPFDASESAIDFYVSKGFSVREVVSVPPPAYSEWERWILNRAHKKVESGPYIVLKRANG